MGQIKFITSMMLITLFTIAIVSYTISFGNDNDAIVKLGDDDDFGILKTNLESDVLTYKTTSNESGTSLFQNKIEAQEVTTTTGSPLNALSTMVNSLKTISGTITNKLLGGKGSEFGVITTGFISIMIVIGLLYGIKTWWGRNPD